MGKLLYVCEDVVPPAANGSSLVYLACLEALARDHEIFAIMFGDVTKVPKETHDRLNSLCKAHLIVRGVQNSSVSKLLTTLSRAVTGQLIAPQLLEELERDQPYKQIAKFIQIHSPEMLYFHKYNCVSRFGRRNLHSFQGFKLLDLHDDFVSRELAERSVLKQLFHQYPSLRHYSSYARIRTKHLLSRISECRSRQQEMDVLSQFDRVLSASESEAGSYSAFMPGKVVYCPWPIGMHGEHRSAVQKSYSAGFIGSDAVFNLEGLLHFVSQILPAIRQIDPMFSFVVAGGVSDPFKLAHPRHQDVGVTVMGRLSHVEDFYKSVSAAVIPLLNGTGVSLKTLEAASYHIPVVATPVGVRGIPSHELPSNVFVEEIHALREAILALPLAMPPVEGSPDYVQQFLSTVNELVETGKRR